MVKNITKSVYITQEQSDWLDAHPSINLSGLVRETINARIIALKE